MTAEKDKVDVNQPTWRKPIGMLFILFLIMLWCGIVVSFIDTISDLNFWLQLPIYLFAGVIWIFPVKPVLIWMNTGSFRS